MTVYSLHVAYWEDDVYKGTILDFKSAESRVLEALARLEMGQTCHYAGVHDRVDLPRMIVIDSNLQDTLATLLASAGRGPAVPVDGVVSVDLSVALSGVLIDTGAQQTGEQT